MNRRDLAKAIAVHADVDIKRTAAVLDALTDVVTAVVSKGEPVVITGFAKFLKVDRAARMGRNPATGEAIRIKASKKARISVGKAFKDAVLLPAQAPKLRKGSYPTREEAVRAAGSTSASAPATRAAGATRATGARTAVPRPAAKRTTAARPKVAPGLPVARKTTVGRKAAAKKTAVARRHAKKSTTAARRTPAKKATTVARRTPAKTTTQRRRPATRTTARR